MFSRRRDTDGKAVRTSEKSIALDLKRKEKKKKIRIKVFRVDAEARARALQQPGWHYPREDGDAQPLSRARRTPVSASPGL